jgi:hypothetical protein
VISFEEMRQGAGVEGKEEEDDEDGGGNKEGITRVLPIRKQKYIKKYS